MTKDDFDNEIKDAAAFEFSKYKIGTVPKQLYIAYEVGFGDGAAKARELMMGEVDLFKKARDKREKEHKEFVMSIENIDVHLDNEKLRAELALAVEALRKYTELPFQLQIPKGEGETLITAINEEFCKVEIFANQTLTKLGADKCLCSETNARNCPVHQ